jgi:uracil phosphoribosyltransferase
MDKVVLKAEHLDGYLTPGDRENLLRLEGLYRRALEVFPQINERNADAEDILINLYGEMGKAMQEICRDADQIHVYSFLSSLENRSEASRLIAKLRNTQTENREFIYYIQRSYEMLFKLAWGGISGHKNNYLIMKTFVTNPVQNYAVHKITNIDDKIGNTVMCIMLRGALLPSMIVSKEIEEYSSCGYITPFALFSIKRNDSRKEKDMEYILDLKKSYFSLEALNGKDLIFADPMNATGGSLVTIIKYILGCGIKPRSVQIFNVICALKGALRVIRAIDNCSVYTLWMDPVLNDDAYIMPGLGDAGDRIVGKDSKTSARGIIQLLTDFGYGIPDLYRSQLREIENTVLAGIK